MVAFYKEVCIIYGAEHPLHILWLCNFISGLVAQLGERSVRIREVVGSNPIRSTKTDTAVDTIVSTAVSLFYRRKRCDCKVLSAIALHFVMSKHSIV